MLPIVPYTFTLSELKLETMGNPAAHTECLFAEYTMPDGGEICVDLIPFDGLFSYSVNSPPIENERRDIGFFKPYNPKKDSYFQPYNGFQLIQVLINDWDFILTTFSYKPW